MSDDDEFYATGTTGSAGGCTINNVPLGEIIVNAQKEGYDYYDDTVTVTSETTSITITMTEPENDEIY